jgi:hypothetical protein
MGASAARAITGSHESEPAIATPTPTPRSRLRQIA